MDYKQALSIPYIFNLIKILITPCQVPGCNPVPECSKITLIKLNNEFYIEDYKKNLFLIQKNMKQYNITSTLDTFIYFENNKMTPINLYLDQLVRPPSQRTLNIELLRFLYMQYAIDKSYFDDKNI
tara:strand:+ start:217 stop:594 length:378 start_codon:yes stop_codon:yes gene_type:complete